jgi:hypothetical protein
MSIGAVYYTDNRVSPEITRAVRNQLIKGLAGAPLVSVGLSRAPHVDIVVSQPRGYLTMFQQILLGLQNLDTKYAFLCEHDVLYHPSHFEFRPPRDDTYYYNLNVWKVDAATGRAVTYITKQTSGLCANRELLVEHYQKRVGLVQKNGFSRRMGFEPGSHGRAERVDDYCSDEWRSEFPNIDIRHTTNLTQTRWSRDQFRSQRSCQGWWESDMVPGWGVVKGRFAEILEELQ